MKKVVSILVFLGMGAFISAQDFFPHKACYEIEGFELSNGDIFVGIDLKTGFFHIESDDVSKSIPIFDDLFITRGLSEEELQNFVIVGHYLELKGL